MAVQLEERALKRVYGTALGLRKDTAKNTSSAGARISQTTFIVNYKIR